jgi:S-adenosylmethionine:tRNA ribosyltransferase-isomerase
MEVFFAEPLRQNVWQVLCKPGRRIRPGDRAVFSGGFSGTFLECGEDGLHVLEMEAVEAVLEQHGRMPLPPYIDREALPEDDAGYQTVFAARPGAVAAPTAGLHFSMETLAAVRRAGVETTHLTLHVGIGTFLPVRAEDPAEHVLRPERYEVGAEAAAILEAARREGRRIIAVGTTTTRTLEYLVQRFGEVRAGGGAADLYILPGFRFRAVSALLTNFHLPRSTLLMLVSAFAGRERILAAYSEAVAQRYRFYSYGDCMLLFR